MKADQEDGAPPPGLPVGAWYRPMVARATDEEHRSATVLELFFDLCFVVAVASAASALHHEVAADHVGDGVVGYATVFFAIWWAWMNFTWFASAYDTDDVAYRLTTLVQIAGALILAAGVPEAMAGGDFEVITVGYVVMRLAMVTQWLRAAATDPPHRRSALRFAAGIVAVQVGWVLRLLLPEGLGYASFLVLVAAELAVPIWAERAAPTTWHPRHIAERYGLFTLIVLGECVLASTLAIQTALEEDAALVDLATTAAGGLLTVFGMWWLYFAKESHQLLTSLRAADHLGVRPLPGVRLGRGRRGRAGRQRRLPHRPRGHRAPGGGRRLHHPGGRVPPGRLGTGGATPPPGPLAHHPGARHRRPGPGLDPGPGAGPGHRPAGGGHDRGLPGRPPPPGGHRGAVAQLGTDQEPSPAMSWLASSGPQVPGSYS